MQKKRVPPRLVLLLWPVIDRLLQRVYHIRPLRADGSGVISVELRRYKGRPFMLSDGTEIKAGDKIVELHFNNAWFRQRRKLKQNQKTSSLPWEVLRRFEEDFNFLAEQVASGMFEGVIALHGVTLIHVGARRLGFQIVELPEGLWKKGARFYMAGLMQMHHLQQGFKPRNELPQLKEVWLSTAALLKKYTPARS